MTLKNILKRVLVKYGDYKMLQKVRRQQKELLNAKRTSSKLAGSESTTEYSNITSIIFSKDRATQLHAFLSSYIALVKNYGKMYIIYKCSNEQHQKSYDELMSIHSQQPFHFIKEVDFRNQLLKILREDEAKSILFYVDDMIFIRPFDYSEIKGIDTSRYILSLSRGKDLTYSIVLNTPLKIPTFHRYSDNFEMFDWFGYNKYSDWEYPLGVSGYMFGRKELLLMLENIPFKAPNSLESNMQKFLPLVRNKKGICPTFVSTVCIHANLVQTEGTNRILGTFSIEDLLDKWDRGLQINIVDFYGKDANIAQEQKYNFIPRNQALSY